MHLNFPVWLFFILFWLSIVFLVMLVLKYRTVKKLKREIKFHKKIIESKSKSHTSGKKRNVFEKGLILSFDKNGDILSINDGFLEFLDYTKAELIGKNIVGNIIPNKDSDGNNMSKIVEHFTLNPKLYIDIETEVISKNNETRWVSWTNRALYDDDGKVKAFTCVGFDITPRKMLEKELADLSSSDVIKGVYNRTSFMDIGNKELVRATRYNRDLAIIVFVVNRNQNHNKNMQQEIRDDVFMQSAVDIVKTLIRDCDYIGRIGDNEFSLLLPETKLINANILMERIEARFAEMSEDEETAFALGSIGSAGRKSGDETLDDLVIRAFEVL